MKSSDAEARGDLAGRYECVRSLTETLAAPLSPEDQTVQSMPDVSPTKWHRAHTSWFFETFVLQPELAGYELFHRDFAYIFNSYYETVGARHPRAERGLISRPGVAEIGNYRRHVDAGMERLLALPSNTEALALVELGLHHEQQHQELLLMDIKHVLSRNPLLPVYRRTSTRTPTDPSKPGWVEHAGGPVEIGHGGEGFAFDNESPRHLVQLTPFALADRSVSCADWLAFMDDGGYHRPELWLSDGWAAVQQQRWEAPLYWSRSDDGPNANDGWSLFTLGGERPVDPAEPVCHVSYYEADAFAHWTGGRLPTEAEWEVMAESSAAGANAVLGGTPGGTSEQDDVNFLHLEELHPRPTRATRPRCSVTSGNGRRAPTRPIRGSVRPRVRSASTTESSWSTSTSCAGDAV